MKKIFIFAVIFAFAFIIVGCGEKSASTDTAPKEPIFFYSNDCGHCQKVEQYIADNKVDEKVEYSKVEAFSTEENYNLFNTKAAGCQIPESQRGVPMIYENGRCYVGEIEAIDFFKSKAGI
ncbi:MAG: hypothetical protein ABIH38_03220 [Patescibacteria group bacterium]